MKENIFLSPKSVEELLQALAKHGEKAMVLAGGTDLVPRMNNGEVSPDIILYMGAIRLRYIKQKKGQIWIGAGTTWTDLIANPLIGQQVPVLAEAAKQGGVLATRNAGTIGGNLVNASPASDLAPPLLALNAKLFLRNKGRERIVPLEKFFVGPGKTSRMPDELLCEIRISPSKGKAHFFKLGRRKAMTLSVVNGAVWMDRDDGKCISVRIALGSVAPTPIRCYQAETLLKGKKLNKALIADCAKAAIAESQPIDDQRSSAWYRRKAGEALLTRTLISLANL